MVTHVQLVYLVQGVRGFSGETAMAGVTKKISTPISQHPRTMNPRIFGTPIPIFLGLRDPTCDLCLENWNPHKLTTLPGVLSRNASLYQEFSQEWFTIHRVSFRLDKSFSVKMIHSGE